MGIQIGGGGFNADPLLAQQRYQDEQQRRAIEEAQALNMQQAQHTASVGAANFGYHQQQQAEQTALAAHAQQIEHQATREQIGDQRNQQEFDRAGQWHDQANQQHIQEQNALAAHQKAIAEQGQADFQQRQAEAERAHHAGEQARAAGLAQTAAHEAGSDFTLQARMEMEEANRLEARDGPTIEFEQHRKNAQDLMTRAPQVRQQTLADKGWAVPEFPGPTIDAEPHIPSGPDEQAMDNTPSLPRLADVRAARSKEKSDKDAAIRSEKAAIEKRLVEKENEKRAYADQMTKAATAAAEFAIKKGKDPQQALDLYQAYVAGVPPDWEDRPGLAAKATELMAEEQKLHDDWEKNPNKNLMDRNPYVIHTPEYLLRKAYPGHGSTGAADAIMRIEGVRQQYPTQPVQAPVQAAPAQPPPSAPVPPKGVTSAASGAGPVTAQPKKTYTPEEAHALPAVVDEESYALVPPDSDYIAPDGKIKHKGK